MINLADNALSIFTDGSQLERPRRGGYAWLYIVTDPESGEEVVHEFSPNGVPGATNQEMELRAVVEALKEAFSARSPVDLDQLDKIDIYTDSTFVSEGFPRAKFSWSQNRYRRSSGAPLLHEELWRELVSLSQRKPVHIKWVPGKKDRNRKLVDKLAKESAKRAFAQLRRPTAVRRKQTEQSVDPGSVPVEGQGIEIQVVTAQPVGRQREYRYKYEVVDDESPYFGRVDFVYSQEPLRTRWVYRVRLNDNPSYPQIAEVLEEVRRAERAASPD